MLILGIDPGSRCAGYGLINVEGKREKSVTYGVIRLDSLDNHQLRLREIYSQIADIVDEYLPDECAVEMPVYGRNPQSMLKLGRAQAAAMLVALNRDIPITEYTPKEVKKSATGNGNASKKQVRYMVRSILSLTEADKELKLDASDALAVALCHAHRNEQGQQSSHGSWESFVKANPDRVS